MASAILTVSCCPPLLQYESPPHFALHDRARIRNHLPG